MGEKQNKQIVSATGVEKKNLVLYGLQLVTVV